MSDINVRQIVEYMAKVKHINPKYLDMLYDAVAKRVIAGLDSYKREGLADYTTLLGTQYWYLTDAGKEVLND